MSRVNELTERISDAWDWDTLDQRLTDWQCRKRMVLAFPSLRFCSSKTLWKADDKSSN